MAQALMTDYTRRVRVECKLRIMSVKQQVGGTAFIETEWTGRK